MVVHPEMICVQQVFVTILWKTFDIKANDYI